MRVPDPTTPYTAGDSPEPVAESSLPSGDGGAPKASSRTRRQWVSALPWRLACILAAVLTAGAGWLVALAYCSLAWVSAGAQGSFEQVLAFSAHAWLLANGVPIALDGGTLGIVPLGFTALIIVMVCSLTGAIARSVQSSPDIRASSRGSRRVGATPGVDGRRVAGQRDRGLLTVHLAGWFTISYTLILVVCINLLANPEYTGRGIVGGLLVGGVFALLGAGRAVRWRLVGMSHGGWMSGVVAGLVAAFALFILASTLLFGLAVVSGSQRIIHLHQALATGAFGGVLFSLAQAMWVPNAVLWAGAWLLGAGFTLGTTTVFSPTHVQLGVIPAIPLFGAAPLGASGSAWNLLWLLLPALAAGVGGAVAVRARRDEIARRPGPDDALGTDAAALLGLVVGILTGLFVCLIQLLATGDLGSVQLVALGARLPQLLVLAPTVMGAAAMVGGWLCAALDHRGARSAAALSGSRAHGEPDAPSEGTHRAPRGASRE